jgi:voltage-gated potassium channel
MIVAGGFVISKLEDLRLIDGVYFAFITALSVGYGDIHPTTTIGKILCVGIALVGMLFVGLTVAIANRALADTARQHLKPSE